MNLLSVPCGSWISGLSGCLPITASPLPLPPQVDATGEGLAAALGGLSLRGVPSPRGRHTRFNDDGEGEGVSRNGMGKHIHFDD